MPRTAMVAKSRIIHSGRFSDWIDTRSPNSIPRANRPWAASKTRSHTSAAVNSRQTPKSFSRINT